MEKSFGLRFRLRKSKNSNDLEDMIYLRVAADGEYAEISSKKSDYGHLEERLKA